MTEVKKVVSVPAITFFDLMHRTKDRPNLKPLPGADSQSIKPGHDRDRWAGASWKDAVSMMENGWIDGARKVEAMLARVDETAAIGPVWTTEAVGQFPNVPAYITGDPECMWQRPDGEITKPQIVLVIKANFHCGIESDDLLRYGVAVSAVLRGLEAAGNDVAVYSVDQTNTPKDLETVCAQGFILRPFGTPLDSSVVAFAFHPAFFRRILFAHRELDKTWTDNGCADNGYGYNLSKLTLDQARKAVDIPGCITVLLSDGQTLCEKGECNSDDKIPALIEKFKGEVQTAMAAGSFAE